MQLSRRTRRYGTTIMAVTDCANAHSAPATVVADLGRSAKEHALTAFYETELSSARLAIHHLGCSVACIYTAVDWR